MLRGIVRGMAAGAIGTLTLNVITYADMAIRGRPSSDAPAKLAGILADKLGLDLSGGTSGDYAKEQIQHRQSGLGALLGYATGLGVGSLYGARRASAGPIAKPKASLALGLVAMAASDGPNGSPTSSRISAMASWSPPSTTHSPMIARRQATRDRSLRVFPPCPRIRG